MTDERRAELLRECDEATLTLVKRRELAPTSEERQGFQATIVWIAGYEEGLKSCEPQPFSTLARIIEELKVSKDPEYHLYARAMTALGHLRVDVPRLLKLQAKFAPEKKA